MNKRKDNYTDGAIKGYKVVSEIGLEEFEKEVNALMDNTYSYNYQLFGGVSITNTENGIRYAQAFVEREVFLETNQ